MNRVVRLSSRASVIAALLIAACGGPSWSGVSANLQCDPQSVYALSPAKDYVVLTSTAKDGKDDCGLMPERLLGTSATIMGGAPGINALIDLSEPNPSGPPSLGGVFQGDLSCNHGTLTSLSGYSDNQCSYSLFQTANATVLGTDHVFLNMIASVSDRRGCSPAGDACISIYVIELGRNQKP
jgi:hypothetical protein